MHITDWLPTFFALAGGNPDHVVEGEGYNVWDIIDNESPPQRYVLCGHAKRIALTFMQQWLTYSVKNVSILKLRPIIGVAGLHKHL